MKVPTNDQDSANRNGNKVINTSLSRSLEQKEYSLKVKGNNARRKELE